MGSGITLDDLHGRADGIPFDLPGQLNRLPRTTSMSSNSKMAGQLFPLPPVHQSRKGSFSTIKFSVEGNRPSTDVTGPSAVRSDKRNQRQLVALEDDDHFPGVDFRKRQDPRRQWVGVTKPPGLVDLDEDTIESDEWPPLAAASNQTAFQSNQGFALAHSQGIEVGSPHITDDSPRIRFPTTQLPSEPRDLNPSESLRKHGRRKILLHKSIMQSSQIVINALLIFSTWWFTRYYYILLPLISATVALNIAMVFSNAFRRTWNAFVPEKIEMPAEKETMVLLIPCYNETKEELVRSLDSLVAQQKIEGHQQAIMIICDGKVRGPGMEKSTADYLLEDILLVKTKRMHIAAAYTAWDQQPMSVVVQKGTYEGMPYMCIVKQQNQGKRDGLIVVRSFLYNFNRRTEQPRTVFSPEFFNEMATYLVDDAKIDNVVHLIGMDADTVFADDCIYRLLQESRYANTVGVCGYVAVDWKDSHWNLWKLYQSAEYTIAQGLRRLHQSLVTHKVSCLPGCCQLLRICEETCGDFVLLELFGYCPKLTDGLLKQIRATASEDRNHVCHMLSARPKVQTRQALWANAYTDVPGSWSVFLSQRRRWTLGATSNDLLLVFAPGVQWFERILAFVNVMTWFLNPFIFASLASFIYAITVVPVWIILCFISVMLIPIVYYFTIPIWLCKSWRERVQFWAGCTMYIFCGPFINISVLVYAFVYMDSFGWGKTRVVIADDDTPKENLSEKESGSEQGSDERPYLQQNQLIWTGEQPARDIGEEEKSLGRTR